jgi:hypothetical protein
VGLVATPWAMGDRNGVAFRATRVEPERVALPPAGFTAELLAAAIRDAATTVAVKLPATSRAPVRSVGWGEQLDIRCIGAEADDLKHRLRQWAHMLGFRGHWSTKSRRYSTTFTALRRARVEHATRERLDPWGRQPGSGDGRGGGVAPRGPGATARRPMPGLLLGCRPRPRTATDRPRGAGRLMR